MIGGGRTKTGGSSGCQPRCLGPPTQCTLPRGLQAPRASPIETSASAAARAARTDSCPPLPTSGGQRRTITDSQRFLLRHQQPILGGQTGQKRVWAGRSRRVGRIRRGSVAVVRRADLSRSKSIRSFAISRPLEDLHRITPNQTFEESTGSWVGAKESLRGRRGAIQGTFAPGSPY